MVGKPLSTLPPYHLTFLLSFFYNHFRMQIHIHRTLTRGELTEYHLIIDGRQICDTLENSQVCLKTGRSSPLCLVIYLKFTLS